MSTATIGPKDKKTANHCFRFESIDDFRRAYFPKDCAEEPGEIDTVDAVGRELAKKSAVLVKSAFALH
jgi:hypothetical protein